MNVRSSGSQPILIEQDVVLARRVTAEGRTRAYVDHRSATVGELRERAEDLIAFYGQHEHRKLTLASAQLAALDGFCGPAHAAKVAEAGAASASRTRAWAAAASATFAACVGPQKPSSAASWALASVSLRCSCWP